MVQKAPSASAAAAPADPNSENSPSPAGSNYTTASESGANALDEHQDDLTVQYGQQVEVSGKINGKES